MQTWIIPQELMENEAAVLCLGRRSEALKGLADKTLDQGGGQISYHARRWYVHVASAFPLGHHYHAIFERKLPQEQEL